MTHLPAARTTPDWDALTARIRRYALALTRDVHEADDLTQHTLAKLLTLGDRVQDREAYAITVATRLWISRQRSLRRGMQRLRQLASWGTARVSPSIGLAGEERQRLEHAIQSLPPVQRAVFVLKVVEELDYQHIAAAMECDVGAVRSNLHLARTRLRERLAPDARGEVHGEGTDS